MISERRRGSRGSDHPRLPLSLDKGAPTPKNEAGPQLSPGSASNEAERSVQWILHTVERGVETDDWLSTERRDCAPGCQALSRKAENR